MKFSHIFTFETFSWLVFLALVVCSSSKIVYKCDFGYPGSNEDCFAEIDDHAVVTTFPMTYDRKIIGALSDVSSIKKQTEDGNLCQIPYRNSVIGQDLYFCLYQLCPTSKTNSSKCFQGNFAYMEISSSLPPPRLTLSKRINDFDFLKEQRLTFFHYIYPMNSVEIEIFLKSGNNDEVKLDFVLPSSQSGWIEHRTDFNASSSFQLLFLMKQKADQRESCGVSLDEIQIKQIEIDEDQTSTDHSQLETTKSFLELSSTNFESTIQTSIETTNSSTTSRPINNTTHSTSKTRITTQQTTGKTSTEKASSSTTSRRTEDTTHSTSKTQITTQETTIHTEEINTQSFTTTRTSLQTFVSSTSSRKTTRFSEPTESIEIEHEDQSSKRTWVILVSVLVPLGVSVIVTTSLLIRARRSVKKSSTKKLLDRSKIVKIEMETNLDDTIF